MVSVHPHVIAYINEFAGDPLTQKIRNTILQFINSKRYVPVDGELQDRRMGYYWWVVDNHSILLRISPPDAYLLGIVDGEIRGRDGIEFYLDKLLGEL